MRRADEGRHRPHAVSVAAVTCLLALAHPLASRAEPKPKPTPEQKMAQRYPQPAKVSYLEGLPVLGDGKSTVGHVRKVVRTADGRIRLVLSIGGFLGIGSSTVSVPVEFLAAAGKQLAFMDGHYAEIAKAPPVPAPDSKELSGDETIRIAIARR